MPPPSPRCWPRQSSSVQPLQHLFLRHGLHHGPQLVHKHISSTVHEPYAIFSIDGPHSQTTTVSLLNPFNSCYREKLLRSYSLCTLRSSAQHYLLSSTTTYTYLNPFYMQFSLSRLRKLTITSPLANYHDGFSPSNATPSHGSWNRSTTTSSSQRSIGRSTRPLSRSHYPYLRQFQLSPEIPFLPSHLSLLLHLPWVQPRTASPPPH